MGSTSLRTASTISAAALPTAFGAAMMWAGVLILLVTAQALGQELNKELSEAIVIIPKKGFLFTAQLETTIYTPEGEVLSPLW